MSRVCSVGQPKSMVFSSQSCSRPWAPLWSTCNVIHALVSWLLSFANCAEDTSHSYWPPGNPFSDSLRVKFWGQIMAGPEVAE